MLCHFLSVFKNNQNVSKKNQEIMKVLTIILRENIVFLHNSCSQKLPDLGQNYPHSYTRASLSLFNFTQKCSGMYKFLFSTCY